MRIFIASVIALSVFLISNTQACEGGKPFTFSSRKLQGVYKKGDYPTNAKKGPIYPADHDESVHGDLTFTSRKQSLKNTGSEESRTFSSKPNKKKN